MAEWETFNLDDVLPDEVTDAAESSSDFIGSLAGVVRTALGLLRVLSAFLSDFPPNPLTAVVATLVDQIRDILEDLRESGVFLLMAMPRTVEDVERYRGGIQNFERIVNRSLYDVADANRPQFGSTGRMGGIVLFFSNSDAASFVRRCVDLFWFLNRRAPLSFPTPVNVSVRPADSEGRPETDLSKLFTEGRELETLFIEWEEPIMPGDVFLDIFDGSQFLVERSKVVDRESPTKQRSENERVPGESSNSGEPLTGRQGAPPIVWEPVDPSNPFVDFDDASSDDDLQLGFLDNSYGMVVRDVEPGIDNGHFYRIRAVPEGLDLVKASELEGVEGEGWVLLRENGEIWNDSEPSQPEFGYLPDVDTSFDLPTAMLNVYRLAYLLRFDATIESGGEVLLGADRLEPPVPEPLIDEVDDEDPPTLEDALFPEGVQDWKETRLAVSLAGPLSGVAEDVEQITSVFNEDPFGGADELFAGSFGASAQERWRTFIDTQAVSKIERTLEDLVANEGLVTAFQSNYESLESQIVGSLEGRFGIGFTNRDIRARVLALLDFMESGLDSGTPPDWENVQFVSDLLPEVDGILKRATGLMESLENALSPPGDALSSSIDSIEQRLSILTAVLDALDTLIGFLESLDLDVFEFGLLWVPPGDGGVPGFTKRLREASNKPDTEADDFAGGVVLAFGGPSETQYAAQLEVMKLLFNL